MKQMNLFKKMASVFLSAAMVLGMSTAAHASSYTDAVSSISLSVSYTLSSGMTKSDIDVSSDTDGVSSVTVSSITNTSYGQRPTVKFTVKANTSDGYYFASSDSSTLKTSSAFSISGDDVTYKSSSRSSNSVVYLTVRLPKIGSTDDSSLDISDVTWSSDENGVVSWADANYATSYDVKLLRGSSTKTTVSTTNTSYDFSSLITQTGTWTVKVRANAGSSSHGSWVESDEMDVDSSLLQTIKNYASTSGSSSSSSSSGTPGTSTTSTGAWLKDATGWWYCNADKSYTVNNWQQINGYWYFFNSQGYMVTGWQKSPGDGNWYYLSTAGDSTIGRMLTSQWVDSNKYYVGSNGIWDQSKTK